MKCPKCKDRTEVLETRTTSTFIRRRRQCLNPHCQHRFTTTESSQPVQPPITVSDEAAIRARVIAREFGSKKVDREALAAALAVDMRRAAIARAARAARVKQRDVWYGEDSEFDPAPDRLDEESLKRELGEF